jgi:hypothetical protein
MARGIFLTSNIRDFRYAPLATRLARHCNVSRRANRRPPRPHSTASSARPTNRNFAGSLSAILAASCCAIITNEFDRLMPCLISSSHGSALIEVGFRLGAGLGDATCLPSIVPRARPLGPGTSFNCLSSFSALRRLRPARSPPRCKIPDLLAQVGRRRCPMIERHHPSPIGVSHP